MSQDHEEIQSAGPAPIPHGTVPPFPDATAFLAAIQTSIEFFRSSGPSAAEAKAWNDLVPNGAEHILQLREHEISAVERQIVHRHSIEAKAVDHEINSSRRGML